MIEKKNKPLIFVTNDDGVYAKGLEALIEMVRPFGDVLVVAPMVQQSCMSHAVTLKNPLRVQKMREEPGLTVYACWGTPVDCVKVGMGELIPRRPNLLVSGINHGANSSINVVYSGTVAAAAEGIFYNIPPIAFSLCNYSAHADFSACIPFGQAIVKQALEKGIPEGICLNVNIPDVSLNEMKGIRICHQNRGAWAEVTERRIDPHGFDYFWLNGEYVNHEPEATDTDEAALANGYVSVVPIKFDYTAYEVLQHMKAEWSDFKVNVTVNE